MFGSWVALASSCYMVDSNMVWRNNTWLHRYQLRATKAYGLSARKAWDGRKALLERAKPLCKSWDAQSFFCALKWWMMMRMKVPQWTKQGLNTYKLLNRMSSTPIKRVICWSAKWKPLWGFFNQQKKQCMPKHLVSTGTLTCMLRASIRFDYVLQ